MIIKVPDVLGSALTNWKTTTVGILSFAFAIVQALGTHSLSEAAHNPVLLLALIGAALGFFGKDGNVTGGTKGQPSTPEALTAANQEHSTVNPPVTK